MTLMNRLDAIDMARDMALAAGQRGDHAYLPTTEAEAENWLPHAWVVDAIAQAFNTGQAKQARVTELAFEALNRNADLGEAAEPDAARFRWLTEDHADPQTRTKCRELLGRMSVMSYSAACADIDSAMAEDLKRSTAPGGGLGA